MKERGMLFSAPMVRALLDGSKTQTRRVVRPLPTAELPTDALPWVYMGDARAAGLVLDEGRMRSVCPLPPCPYGQPSDRLWVRETHLRSGDDVMYSDDDDYDVCYPEKGSAFAKGLDLWRVVPSIFMPRALSRITLEITEVRVQRIQEISREDAIAEGVTPPDAATTVRGAFSCLWEEINGKKPERSWFANPWVFAISFRRIA